MKYVLFATVAALLLLTGCSQKSPLKESESQINNVNIKVVYSSPFAKGRKIMGGLVPYDQVWRTGANEATSIEFDKDVKLGGNDLAAGKYSLFTVPGEKEWEIIINKQTGMSGTEYDQASDVFRFKVPSKKIEDFVESFTITVEGEGVALEWENTAVKFKVE